MFEHFSLKSREVIVNTKKYAVQANTGALLPSHLLRALAETPELQESFTNLNIDTDRLIYLLASETPLTNGDATPGKMRAEPVGPIFKRSLKIILAQKLKQIEPVHLLFATLECADEGLLNILQEAGFNGTDDTVFGVQSTPAEPTPIGDSIQDRLGLTDEENIAASMIFQIIPGGGVRRNQTPQVGARRPQPQKQSFLDNFADNLTQKAIDGNLDPVIGRSKEIRRITQILARRNKNNPVLLGEPGVGKTAVIEGLAQELLKDSAPASLRNKKIYALDLPSVVAGTRYRGDFEERMKKIMKEVTSNPDIILFIDEIHTLVGSGSGEGSMDGGNIMKPALARGEMQTIGATTITEYKKYFEKDAALERRFQSVMVKEPTVDETVQILYGLRDRYEDFHQVTISNEALQAAAELSSRYIQDRFLPDKAIDLIDEAAARVKLDAGSVLTEKLDLSEIDNRLDMISKAKKDAILQNTYTKASSLNAEEHDLIQERQQRVEEWKAEHPETGSTRVTDVTIADLLAETTGIPVYRLTETETNKLLRMEKDLHKRVIGQNDAVKVLSRTIRRQRTGLKDPNRPIGSFIFAGPTGVGKTELVKALTQFLFNDEKSLISLDMSEYSEKHTVARLFGAPPGYVGYEEGGQLTERVRRNPFSVVLFDEIEKAHPDVFDALLQILEEGRLTDGQGKTVDFKNTVVVMTTNLGSSEITNGSLGFQASNNVNAEYTNMKNKVGKALKEALRPEFLNRVDEILVFPHLKENELLQIVDVFLNKLNERILSEGLSLNVSDVAKKKLAVDGYDKALGARPLRRVIQREIETPLSEAILFGKTAKTGVIEIDVNNENVFTFNGFTHAELELEIEKIEASM